MIEKLVKVCYTVDKNWAKRGRFMKKIVTLLLSLVCLIALVACNPKADEERVYFVGKVIEVYDGRCLLEVTNNGNQGIASGDVVVVNTDIENCPTYAVGDFLRIEFDGTMALSYPPQILRVYAIAKTDAIGNGIA